MMDADFDYISDQDMVDLTSIFQEPVATQNKITNSRPATPGKNLGHYNVGRRNPSQQKWQSFTQDFSSKNQYDPCNPALTASLPLVNNQEPKKRRASSTITKLEQAAAPAGKAASKPPAEAKNASTAPKSSDAGSSNRAKDPRKAAPREDKSPQEAACAGNPISNSQPPPTSSYSGKKAAGNTDDDDDDDDEAENASGDKLSLLQYYHLVMSKIEAYDVEINALKKQLEKIKDLIVANPSRPKYKQEVKTTISKIKKMFKSCVCAFLGGEGGNVMFASQSVSQYSLKSVCLERGRGEADGFKTLAVPCSLAKEAENSASAKSHQCTPDPGPDGLLDEASPDEFSPFLQGEGENGHGSGPDFPPSEKQQNHTSTTAAAEEFEKCVGSLLHASTEAAIFEGGTTNPNMQWGCPSDIITQEDVSASSSPSFSPSPSEAVSPQSPAGLSSWQWGGAGNNNNNNNESHPCPPLSPGRHNSDQEQGETAPNPSMQRAWPCANISLGAAIFEGGTTNPNMQRGCPSDIMTLEDVAASSSPSSSEAVSPHSLSPQTPGGFSSWQWGGRGNNDHNNDSHPCPLLSPGSPSSSSDQEEEEEPVPNPNMQMGWPCANISLGGVSASSSPSSFSPSPSEAVSPQSPAGLSFWQWGGGAGNNDHNNDSHPCPLLSPGSPGSSSDQEEEEEPVPAGPLHNGSSHSNSLAPLQQEPRPPGVYVENVTTWHRTIPRFNANVYTHEFRFHNLDQISSFSQAVEVLHRAIQDLLDNFLSNLEDGDVVQMRLQSQVLRNPLFSLRRGRDNFNAEDFLNNIENLLQSNTEICIDSGLRLFITVIRAPRGGARRILKSIPSSKIVEMKRRFLIDFNCVGYNLCFAGGLLGALAVDDRPDAELLADAKKLHMDLGWAYNRKVTFSDLPVLEQHLRINIQVVSWGEKGWALFKTDEPRYSKTCFMFFHENHFYGIKNVRAFFGSKNYCSLCHALYDKNHSCFFMCGSCRRMNCTDDNSGLIHCDICKILCKSQTCLHTHLNQALEQPELCRPREWCRGCQSYVRPNHDGRCPGKRCRICKIILEGGREHLCFMQKLPRPVVNSRIVFFDTEAMQDTGIHIPNFIHARSLMAETNPHFKTMRKWPHYNKEWSFRGENCVSEFIETFTKKASFRNSVFIAHNAKAYDSYFIVRELIRQKLDPDLITQGGKIQAIVLNSLKITFIDSLNHLPMALAKLPSCLGFESVKGFFPHFFNTAANQNYVGPLPAPHFYGVDTMKPKEKEEFLKWHNENLNKPFDLQKELEYYCKQDVKILEEACTRYRDEIISMTRTEEFIEDKNGNYKKQVTAIDPFQSLTLASVCLKMYRFCFLKPETIAIPDPRDYHGTVKRFSTASIQWLTYIEHTEKIHIRHALKGGEVQVGSYFLDGYAFVNNQKIAFEYFGCFFHGCRQCYSLADRNPLTGSSFEFLYNATQRKLQYLKKCGFEIRTIWEHEWISMTKTEVTLQNFLTAAKFPEPLCPRDALYGGRTNAICLYYKPQPGERIHYYDFTSLYPFVNKTKPYPIGHPTIIYQDFQDLENYFGLAKVRLVPPRKLYFPVLPVKIGGKLMFPLCRTCAENRQLSPCSHSDDQRALEGVWCTIELNLALKTGYKLLKIFEVWHFEERSETLFSEYIKMHLKRKQEASGYPDWCVTDEDKNKYIQSYYEKEGIKLDAGEIRKNPAKRQIAKLFLNSLWGKFAQRVNLPNTEIVRDPNYLFQLLFSEKYEVSSFDFIDDEAVCVSWKQNKARIVPPSNTNVFIAAFTTSFARVQLYNLIQKLDRNCLYHDTDSVIFVSREGDWVPELGDYLGDLTSEIPSDQHITEFVAAGPKSYAYRLSDNSVCIKVKGITLNSANSEKITFNSLKDLVFSYVSERDGQAPQEIVVQQNGIVRNKNQFLIETKPLRKTQRVVYDKRVIVDDFKTLPYGY